jgi:hypothetical protein
MLCMNHNSATIINKWNHFTSSIFVVQCLWNCFSLICYYDISNSVVNLFLVRSQWYWLFFIFTFISLFISVHRCVRAFFEIC